MGKLSKFLMGVVLFLGGTGTLFAQGSQQDGDAIAAGVGLVFILIFIGVSLLIGLISIIGMWKTFTKAGEPGWACIVPIYNIVVMCNIAGVPLWWVILFFLPFVNVIISFILLIKLANAFGKGVLFGIGLALFPALFFPILGFGNSRYIGN